MLFAIPSRRAARVRLPPSAPTARRMASASTCCSMVPASCGRPCGEAGADARISAGRSSQASESPSASSPIDAMTFRSSRTLPGQPYAVRAASASGETQRGLPRSSANHPEEALGQCRDVLGPLAERRDAEAGHRHAIEEIHAEPARRNLAAEVPVRRRDQPELDLAGTALPEAAESRRPLARAAGNPAAREASPRSRRGRGSLSPRPPSSRPCRRASLR